MKYITITFLRKSDSGLTNIYVVAKIDGAALGRISWRGQWRKYTYMPSEFTSTIYDASCLREIADFCEQETNNHNKDATSK